MTITSRSALALFCLSIAILCNPLLFAERVKEVLPNGHLRLEGGQNVRLAGIQVGEDSQSLLSALLSGQDVSVEYENSPSGSPELSAYVFIKSKELSFPFKNSGNPEESKRMVNQLLLDLGAARVVDGLTGKWKDRFLQSESEARKKGEGIWSYEQVP